jgi:hypothetical protein
MHEFLKVVLLHSWLADKVKSGDLPPVKDIASKGADTFLRDRKKRGVARALLNMGASLLGWGSKSPEQVVAEKANQVMSSESSKVWHDCKLRSKAAIIRLIASRLLDHALRDNETFKEIREGAINSNTLAFHTDCNAQGRSLNCYAIL